MLGCASEHTGDTQAHGCQQHDAHPAGIALAPPVVLQLEGLASWPQPKDFDPDQPYPAFHLQQRKLDAMPMTFVYAVVDSSIPDKRAASMVQDAMFSAAKFHPGCRLAAFMIEHAYRNPSIMCS